MAWIKCGSPYLVLFLLILKYILLSSRALFVNLDVVELVILGKWQWRVAEMLLWYENISKDFMDREKFGKTVLWMRSIRQRLTLPVCWMVWTARMRESGGKLVYEMRAGIKTMKEELRKQAKKEKRSNVLLFVSRGLFIYCTFVCFYVFVLDHVYLYSNR